MVFYKNTIKRSLPIIAKVKATESSNITVVIIIIINITNIYTLDIIPTKTY